MRYDSSTVATDGDRHRPHQTASRIAIGLAGRLLAIAGLAGCNADRPARPTSVPAATAASTTAASTPRPVTLADAKRCPVALPAASSTPDQSSPPRTARSA